MEYIVRVTKEQREALGDAVDWAYVDVSDGLPYLDEEYKPVDLAARAKKFLTLGEFMENELGFHGEVNRWTELANRYDAAAKKGTDASK
jgi:hypothetical protein